MPLMPVTVYTILKSEILHAAFKEGGTLRLAEGKRWVRAARLLAEALEQGKSLPIVFAPGEKTQELIYHGRIAKVEVRAKADKDKNRSYVRVTDLTPFREPRPKKTDLVVESTRRRIPAGHIRPYVLCRTPGFLTSGAAASRRGRVHPAREPQAEAKPTYLLVWNVKRWHWFDDLSEALSLRNGRHHGSWSCGANRTMPPGSRVFLVKCGEEPRGIVASGRATSGPNEGKHWDEKLARTGRTAWYVDCAFDRLLNPGRESILTLSQLKKVGLGHVNWTPQGSGILLEPDVATRLEATWVRFLNEGPRPVLSLPDGAIEGQRTEIRAYRRGRSRILRDAALRNSEGICEACRIDFNTVLDGKGVRVLQVHHRRQQAASDTPRLNRVADLAVLCANCHSLVHMNPNKALPVATLQKMLKGARRGWWAADRSP